MATESKSINIKSENIFEGKLLINKITRLFN